MGRSCRTLFAPCLLMLCVVGFASPASATSPAKLFPDFASLKDSLGVLPMVADVLGNVEKVYLDDCKVLGARVLAAFDSAMTLKGYQVEPRPLLSVGSTLSPDARFNVLSTWSQHTMDVTKVPVTTAPFYVDSAQCPDSFSRSNWKGTMKRVAGYRLDGSFPGVFPEALSLRDTTNRRYLLVVTIASVRVPQGKIALHSMISSGFLEDVLSQVDPCNPDVNNGIVLTQVSSTLLKVAVIDRRHGEAVWADGECQTRTLKANLIDGMMRNVIKRLP